MNRSHFGSRVPGAGISAIAVLLLQALVQPAMAQQASTPVTFARDVAPILQKNCQECHRPGSIGPMSLRTYEEVRPWVRAIKRRVADREMPPYRYDKIGIQHLKDDLRLSDADIQTIVRWVDSGAPLGDPADLAARRAVPRSREVGVRGPVRSARPHRADQAVHPSGPGAGPLVAADRARRHHSRSLHQGRWPSSHRSRAAAGGAPRQQRSDGP